MTENKRTENPIAEVEVSLSTFDKSQTVFTFYLCKYFSGKYSARFIQKDIHGTRARDVENLIEYGDLSRMALWNLNNELIKIEYRHGSHHTFGTPLKFTETQNNEHLL